MCELRPDSRRKILAVASKAKFDQILVKGDFNLSEIDWQTGTANSGDCLHNYFTKLLKDNYLWQLVDFLTRGKNILALILTTIPTKVQHIHGFDDIICTDHKLISFELDLKVPKKSRTKRVVYNFKRADWSGLKETLHACVVPDNVDTSLDNWYDLFVAAADDHIPKCKARSVNDLHWIDNELGLLLKKKDDARKKLNVSARHRLKLRLSSHDALQRKHLGGKRKGMQKNLKHPYLKIPSASGPTLSHLLLIDPPLTFLRIDINL